jgi:hypothetical protein
MKFAFHSKFFYIGWDLKNTHHMEEQFGISFGNYYIGYYYGDGWCAGFLDANGCL